MQGLESMLMYGRNIVLYARDDKDGKANQSKKWRRRKHGYIWIRNDTCISRLLPLPFWQFGIPDAPRVCVASKMSLVTKPSPQILPSSRWAVWPENRLFSGFHLFPPQHMAGSMFIWGYVLWQTNITMEHHHFYRDNLEKSLKIHYKITIFSSYVKSPG